MIASGDPPKTILLTFARGYSEGAAKTALVGAGGAAVGAATAFMLAPLLLFAGPAGIAAMPAFVAGGAGVGFATGTVAGAQAILPEEQAIAIERMTATVVDEGRLAQLTATAIAENTVRVAARDASVVGVGATAPTDYRSLRDHGFGAVIEVKPIEVGFLGYGSDPVIALFMTAEARLVDTTTGRPAAMRGLAYVSASHRGAVWARDDAALAKIEVQRAYGTLAERIVDHFVLRADETFDPATPAADFLFGPDVPTRVCGLAPRARKLEWAGGIVEARHLADSTAQSLTPTLEWDGRPAAHRDLGDARWAGVAADDIRYDLRIWNAIDDAPGVIVYEREGLDRPRHHVEVPLEPASTYFWTVRMRYRLAGRWYATRWSAANPPLHPLGKPLRDAIFYSRAEGDALKPVACANGDFTPCRCLDFIPTANLFRLMTP